MAVVRAAAFLRHFLAHQHREAAHRLDHHVLARPARLDPRLQRLDRLHVGGAQYGGAHVADHVIRCGQARVGQQRQDRFAPATGDPGELDVGMGVHQVVQAFAGIGIAGQEGAVQVGGEKKRLCGLFQQAHAGALQGGEMPRTRHDAKASTDAGGDSSHRKEAPERRRKQGVACEARYAQKRCRCASVPEAWTRTSTDAMQHCSSHRRRAGQRDVKNVKSRRDTRDALIARLSSARARDDAWRCTPAQRGAWISGIR